MQRLTGKTCLVTGAARSIGRAIATRFRQEGGEVIVTDIDEAGGTAVAAEIGARFIRLDVAREDDWLRLADLVPTVDVVVNNAGIAGFESGPVRHDPEHARVAAMLAPGEAAYMKGAEINLDGGLLAGSAASPG